MLCGGEAIDRFRSCYFIHETLKDRSSSGGCRGFSGSTANCNICTCISSIASLSFVPALMRLWRSPLLRMMAMRMNEVLFYSCSNGTFLAFQSTLVLSCRHSRPFWATIYHHVAWFKRSWGSYTSIIRLLRMEILSDDIITDPGKGKRRFFLQESCKNLKMYLDLSHWFRLVFSWDVLFFRQVYDERPAAGALG